MRPAGRWALSVTLLLLLSACSAPRDSPPATSSPASRDSCSPYERPTFSTAEGFQGQNAMAHVLRLSCDFDVSPAREQPRIPGTPGRLAAAEYLYATLQAAGWQPRYQNFTGEDYDALPKDSVEAYAKDDYYCDAEERKRMLGLEFSNVVGELGSGGRLTILMAHYDSQRHASRERDPVNQTKPVGGANDASGVGVLVEAARVYAASPPSGTVRILLVDGEDGFEECHPLAGSIYHARSLSEEDKARLDGVYLLDMVGDPDPHFCLAGNTVLAERLRGAGRNESVPVVADASGCTIYDDHTAFLDAGLSAVDLVDYDPHRPGGFTLFWNTTRDTPDKLSAERLGEVGRVVVALLS